MRRRLLELRISVSNRQIGLADDVPCLYGTLEEKRMVNQQTGVILEIAIGRTVTIGLPLRFLMRTKVSISVSMDCLIANWDVSIVFDVVCYWSD